MRILRRLVAGSLAVALLMIPLTSVAADSQSRIRVLHASPDAPAVDVYLDGNLVSGLTNVTFGTISPYLSVAPGAHVIKITATGSTTAVIEAPVTLEAGRSYTVAAIGPLASIGPKVFVDDPAPASGSAKVRVVHLSPDAPAVDVAPDGAAPSDAIVKNLAYPDATAYLSVPPGSYDLEVRLAGTTTVALQLNPLTLASGRAYSVFAIGSAAAEPLGGNALRALVTVDAVAAPATDTSAAAGSDGGPVSLHAALLVLLAAVAVVTGALTWRLRAAAAQAGVAERRRS